MTKNFMELMNGREKSVRAEIKQLEDELRQIKMAKAAVFSEKGPSRDPRLSRQPSQHDMIITILDETPEGMTSNAIVAEIEKRFGIIAPQSSAQTRLSQARGKGLVSRDAGTRIWRSAKHYDGVRQKETGATNIAPEAETDEGYYPSSASKSN